MEYMTRRLLALRPFRYMGRDLGSGEEFQATDADCRYLIRSNKACTVVTPAAEAKKFPFPVTEEQLTGPQVIPTVVVEEKQEEKKEEVQTAQAPTPRRYRRPMSTQSFPVSEEEPNTPTQE